MSVFIKRIIFSLILIIPFCTILVLQYAKEQRISIHLNELTDVPQFLFTGSIVSLLLLSTAFHLLIRKGEISFRLSVYHLFLLLFFIYFVANYFLFCNPSDNATHNSCLYLIALLILYVAAKGLSRSNFQGGCYAIMVLHIAIAIWSGLQLFHFVRQPIPYQATGPFSNSGELGNFLVCTFPLFICLIGKKNSYLKGILLVVMYLMTLGILLYIIARIALIAHLITGILIVLIVLKRRGMIISRKLVQAIAVVLICISFLFLNIKQGSNKGRLLIYKTSLSMLPGHLITGVGVNNFRLLYNHQQAAYLKQHNDTTLLNYADNTYLPFNEYLLVLIEYGFIGLFLFMGAIYYWLKYKLRINYVIHISLYAAAALSLLAIAICAVASYPFHNTLIAYTMVLCAAIIAGFTHNTSVSMLTFRLRKIHTRVLSSLFILLSILAGVYSCLQWRALLYWQKAANDALYERREESVSAYHKAYSVYHGNGSFLYNYGAEMVLQDKPQLGLSLLLASEKYYSNSNLNLFIGDAYLKLKNFRQAETYYLQAIDMVPSRIYYKYKLAKFYVETRNFTLARKWAQIVIDYPVKVYTAEAYQMKEEMKVWLGSL